MDRSLLEKKQLAELREIASTLDLRGYQRMKKADLVDLIVGADDGDAAPANGSGNGDGGRARDDSDAGRDDGATDATEDDGDDEDDEDDDARNRNRSRRRKNRGGGNQGSDLEDAEVREGVLDLLPEGYGFLRTTGYLSGSRDVYVSQSYVRRFNLRRGDRVRGPIRSNNRGNDKFPALARVDAIEGLTVDEHMADPRGSFAELTAVAPDERIRVGDGGGAPLALRVVDLLAPIGKGQRGLVVAPPRAGRTTLMRQLAEAVAVALPDAHLMVLLVDERPEEVTAFERAVDGEVVSSTFDHPAEDHTSVAELALERAKRLVERGRDVVLLVDSLTRLARAYNLAAPGSGRTLPGGMDAAALHPVKRFVGAARNIEEGGSLTMIATAVTDSGSALDDVVLESLAGTATMQVRLRHTLVPGRVFPAIDVVASGTHHDELLLDDEELSTARKLRADLADLAPAEALEVLADRLS